MRLSFGQFLAYSPAYRVYLIPTGKPAPGKERVNDTSPFLRHPSQAQCPAPQPATVCLICKLSRLPQWHVGSGAARTLLGLVPRVSPVFSTRLGWPLLGDNSCLNSFRTNSLKVFVYLEHNEKPGFMEEILIRTTHECMRKVNSHNCLGRHFGSI